jgi:hypothetical protein
VSSFTNSWLGRDLVRGPSPVVIIFEAMFDDLVGATTGTREGSAVAAWARVESAACARRLAGMAAMLDSAYAAEGSEDREQ